MAVGAKREGEGEGQGKIWEDLCHSQKIEPTGNCMWIAGVFNDLLTLCDLLAGISLCFGFY